MDFKSIHQSTPILLTEKGDQRGTEGFKGWGSEGIRGSVGEFSVYCQGDKIDMVC